MDHLEVRETLELAAVEPGGLDRLMAGDTGPSSAVAGHLAGCEACTTELERLGRAVPLLRDVVRTTPAPDLRDRTLAYVREHGRVRALAVEPVVAAAGSTGSPASSPDPAVPVPAEPDRASVGGSGRPSPLPWVAAIAAAVLLSVVATSLLLGGRFEQQERAIAGLQAVTAATIAVTTEPDSARVALAGAGGSTATGSLLFSPRTTELVVVARGLERPADGREFRCWLEIAGERQSVGRMFFAGDLAYWVGDTPAVAGLPAGTEVTFGVSLVDLGAPSLDADPVIVGRL